MSQTFDRFQESSVGNMIKNRSGIFQYCKRKNMSDKTGMAIKFATLPHFEGKSKCKIESEMGKKKRHRSKQATFKY